LHEQREQEQRAKELLLQRSIYHVSVATGLPHSRLVELKSQALAEQEQRTRQAIRERSELLEQSSPGRDHLARRIEVLRSEEEDQPASSFPELADAAESWRRLTY
jgi:hypothetical protein